MRFSNAELEASKGSLLKMKLKEKPTNIEKTSSSKIPTAHLKPPSPHVNTLSPKLARVSHYLVATSQSKNQRDKHPLRASTSNSVATKQALSVVGG
jgi:hypothetical protein